MICISKVLEFLNVIFKITFEQNKCHLSILERTESSAELETFLVTNCSKICRAINNVNVEV